MNKKSATDITLADFHRRFPTTKDLVAYLLANKPNRTVTADQLYHEMAGKKAGPADDNTDSEKVQ